MTFPNMIELSEEEWDEAYAEGPDHFEQRNERMVEKLDTFTFTSPGKYDALFDGGIYRLTATEFGVKNSVVLMTILRMRAKQFGKKIRGHQHKDGNTLTIQAYVPKESPEWYETPDNGR